MNDKKWDEDYSSVYLARLGWSYDDAGKAMTILVRASGDAEATMAELESALSPIRQQQRLQFYWALAVTLLILVGAVVLRG